MGLPLAGIGLWLLIVLQVFLPPKFDPAFVLKSWVERKRREVMPQ